MENVKKYYQKRTWKDNALQNFDAYKSKFIVHDDEEIYFASISSIEANDWIAANKDTKQNLACFLLPKNFFSRKV